MSALNEEDKRVARNRQEKRYRDEQARKQYHEREHLRGEIKSRKYIRVIDEVVDMLKAGREPVFEDGVTGFRELDRTWCNRLPGAGPYPTGRPQGCC